jgi:pyridoxamine 5'-phosphate oxidase
LREKAWFDSSPRLRASFGSPYPGHPKTSEIQLPKLDSSQGPLDNFCVLTLDPKEVYFMLLCNATSMYSQFHGWV